MPPLPAGFSVAAEVSQSGIVRYQKRQFGDGYMQVVPDGINPGRVEWNLTFPPMNLSQGNQLFNFFMGLGSGVTIAYVQWTAPDGEYADWLVEDVRREWQSTGTGFSSISCRFIRITAV